MHKSWIEYVVDLIRSFNRN